MLQRKAIVIVLLWCISASGTLFAKEVVGWVETVKIYPGGILVKAKLDTGAKTSSLDCECITPFKRDGKDWLSFSVKNHEGVIVRLEKPVTRVARIKRHFWQGAKTLRCQTGDLPGHRLSRSGGDPGGSQRL